MGIIDWLKKVFGKKPEPVAYPHPIPAPLPPEDPIVVQERLVASIEIREKYATERFCEANRNRLSAMHADAKAAYAREHDEWFAIHRNLQLQWAEEYGKLQKMKTAAGRSV